MVRVRRAPLPRTLQADLPIHRIGSDLLPMIIGAALALACGLVANLLLRMIAVGLKSLPTVAATVILHQATPEENGRGSFSLETPSKNLRRHPASFDGRHDARVRVGVSGPCRHPTIMWCTLVYEISGSSRLTIGIDGC